ncbi:hypothetical protein [Polyangium spumosum]|uniref:Nucleoside phosphorylase domain-containing protein n=1 Tax=Polyangium spumosum TaxID=889282 RepID=A0A6N7PKM5_9BACT|nr:hypothetical protein [Polyangium spumosum]MRG92568.1 hypothetical protein [Polyangium spumosum]
MDAKKIEQRRILRDRLIGALYEAARGGNLACAVDLKEVGERESIPYEEIKAAWHYFQQQRWVKTRGTGMIVAITVEGVDYVEKLIVANQTPIASPFDEQTTTLPDQADPMDSFDIAIVCALNEKELDCVLDTGVTPWQPLHFDNDPATYYQTTFVRTDGAPLRVVAAAAPQMGMPDSAVLATKMILHFAPNLVAMVGIAAGADEAKQGFGDILAPDTTFDYGSGKLFSDGDGLKLKPDPKPLAIEPRLTARLQDWKRQRRHVDTIRQAWRSDKPRTSLEIHIGPMGSGSAVLDSKKPLTDIVEHWRKLIGIDMEAHGIHLACQYACTPKPWFLCVKAISDFAANKTDSWQPYAAFIAAQFLYRFVTEEWRNFSFPSRAAVGAPQKQQGPEMASVIQEIAHLKEQLGVQKEQLAFQTGSIREILASITAVAPKVESARTPGAGVGVASISELKALEGLWVNVESGSTYCMRMVRGELRCPYSYGTGNKLTGEYHSLRIENGSLFGRYRWFNDAIAGYFYLRIESLDRLVGGWWSASDATAEAMAQLPPAEGMVASTWIRQKDVQRFPEWAEAFFGSITPATALEPTSEQQEVVQQELEVDLEQLAEEVVERFAMRLVDENDTITGLMAETNASGYYLDQLDVLSVGPLELNVPRIPFRAQAHFSGDQEPDHVACGNAITAEISGTLEYDGTEWRVADDYRLEAELDYDHDGEPDPDDL